MYAIIETGGKQYKAACGQTIRVEKLSAEIEETVKFETVLLIDDGEKVQVGQPYVEKACVEAVVTEHGRGEKIRILKFKRRKNHMKRQGHRQDYTTILVKDVRMGAVKKASKSEQEAETA